MTDRHGDFDSFIAQVHALLEPTASGKGYSTTGVNGFNQLYEFVASFAGPHHALGEIVYKAKRYEAKRNIEDVLKIAAWAFLVYKHHAQPATFTDADVTAQFQTGDGHGVKFVEVEPNKWVKA